MKNNLTKGDKQIKLKVMKEMTKDKDFLFIDRYNHEIYIRRDNIKKVIIDYQVVYIDTKNECFEITGEFIYGTPEEWDCYGDSSEDWDVGECEEKLIVFKNRLREFLGY